MADNVTVDNGALTDIEVATDKVTHSGDANREIQLVRIVQTTGAEGAKTVVDLPGDATDGLLVNLGANNDVTVSGVSTAANQTTIIGHVDGIEGLLGTIDADTGSILTSVQVSDNVVVVLGTDTYTEATSSGTVMAAVRRDADTTLANTTNEYTPLQVDANGRLKVEAFSGEALPVTLTSTTITGTVAVTQSGTWDEIGINDSGNSITVDGTITEASAASILTAVQLIDDTVQVLGTDTYTEATSKGITLGAVRRDADTTLVGTTNEFGPLQMDALGRLKVEVFDGGDSHTVDGTVAVSSLPASTNTIEVVGDAAHDAALAGNPVRIGARGVSADPAVITTGRTVDILASLLGKQIVLPYCHPGAGETYASPAAVTDTADDAVFAAVASTRHYVTGVQVFNGHDTVGTEVVIKDGSTVLWRGWAEQTGGGCSARFDPPLRGTANTAINVANITTGSSTYFNVQGYQATE